MQNVELRPSLTLKSAVRLIGALLLPQRASLVGVEGLAEVHERPQDTNR